MPVFCRTRRVKSWQIDGQTGVETDRYASRETEPEVACLHRFSVVCRFRFCLMFSFSVMGFVRSCQIVPWLFSELSGQDVFNLPYLLYLPRKDKYSSFPFFPLIIRWKSRATVYPYSFKVYFDILVVRGHVKEIDVSDLQYYEVIRGMWGSRFNN